MGQVVKNKSFVVVCKATTNSMGFILMEIWFVTFVAGMLESCAADQPWERFSCCRRQRCLQKNRSVDDRRETTTLLGSTDYIFKYRWRKTCFSQLLQCWGQNHCGCAWLWCGSEAVVPTACSPASPSKRVAAKTCPTTWLSFPTWWSTMIRTLQPVKWRWVLQV